MYRAPLALGVRGAGVGAIGLGSTVVGTAVTVAGDPNGAVRIMAWTVLAALALGSLTILVTGVLRATGLRTRLVLDDDGFVNATGPGVGLRRVSWRDVRKVQADGTVVSVDVAGDRRSVIRTAMLEVSARELARELRSRLNRNRGYTPLRAPSDADHGSE